MNNNNTLTNLQTLLFFPFREPGGRNKLLVASAVGLASLFIPILPWLFLLGYAGTIMKRIILERGEPFMPEWDNLADFLPLGLKLFGVTFVYSLPPFGAILVGYFSMILMPAVIGAASAGGDDPSFAAFLLVLVGSFALMMVGMVLILGVYAILPAALSHTVARDSFAAGFRVREWWGILRANPGGFAVTLVLAGGLYMLMMFAFQILYFTVILCFLIPFLMGLLYAYMTIVSFPLFALAYRDGIDKLEAQAG